MTCHDLVRLWDEVLDARDAGRPDLDPLIAAHADACPACRATSARYQALRVAIAASGPAPRPSAGLADRFLAATLASPEPMTLAVRWRRPALAAAVAASLLGSFWLGGRTERPVPTPRRHAVRIDLASALADARSATIDLARGVSAPAARIGRDVFDLEGEGDVEPDGPESNPIAAGPSPSTADLLRSMGERINAGTRPLSGSARHGFAFLLPAPPEADRPPPPGSLEER